MGVHLSTEVVGKDAEGRLVNESDGLNVVRGLHPLDTLQSTSGDQTRSVAGLGAVSNHFSFDASNILAELGRTPETEVIDGVEVHGLAQRILASGGSITDVVSLLLATNETYVGVDAVGQSGGVREPFVSERGGG